MKLSQEQHGLISTPVGYLQEYLEHNRKTRDRRGGHWSRHPRRAGAFWKRVDVKVARLKGVLQARQGLRDYWEDRAVEQEELAAAWEDYACDYDYEYDNYMKAVESDRAQRDQVLSDEEEREFWLFDPDLDYNHYYDPWEEENDYDLRLRPIAHKALFEFLETHGSTLTKVLSLYEPKGEAHEQRA